MVYQHGYTVQHLTAELLGLAQAGYLKIVHYQTEILFFKSSNYLYVQLKSSADLPPVAGRVLDAVFNQKFTISQSEALRAVAGDSDSLATLESDIQRSIAITQVRKMRNAFTKHLQTIKKLAIQTAVEHG